MDGGKKREDAEDQDTVLEFLQTPLHGLVWNK